MDRDVYVAIADPTRRDILSFLNTRDELTAGEIADQFDHLTRPAVSRHLRVLRECGVVLVLKSGKNQHYALNPDPLNAIRQGWLKGFSSKQVKSLKALRRLVESNNH